MKMSQESRHALGAPDADEVAQLRGVERVVERRRRPVEHLMKLLEHRMPRTKWEAPGGHLKLCNKSAQHVLLRARTNESIKKKTTKLDLEINMWSFSKRKLFNFDNLLEQTSTSKNNVVK